MNEVSLLCFRFILVCTVLFFSITCRIRDIVGEIENVSIDLVLDTHALKCVPACVLVYYRMY
jgi:hypothetical protein